MDLAQVDSIDQLSAVAFNSTVNVKVVIKAAELFLDFRISFGSTLDSFNCLDRFHYLLHFSCKLYYWINFRSFIMNSTSPCLEGKLGCLLLC
jgi:hypothetical protein